MQYVVISGDFKASIKTSTPREAAEEALSLWRLKINKPNLAKITTVVKPDNQEVYFCTNSL